MTGNYQLVNGVEVSEWADGETEPVKQRRCKLEEMYHETASGDLVITFEDRDTGRFFDVSVPIKADPDWNELVESLPTWSYE